MKIRCGCGTKMIRRVESREDVYYHCPRCGNVIPFWVAEIIRYYLKGGRFEDIKKEDCVS